MNEAQLLNALEKLAVVCKGLITVLDRKMK